MSVGADKNFLQQDPTAPDSAPEQQHPPIMANKLASHTQRPIEVGLGQQPSQFPMPFQASSAFDPSQFHTQVQYMQQAMLSRPQPNALLLENPFPRGPQIQQQQRQSMLVEAPFPRVPEQSQTETRHALRDYHMQLALLEQENVKKYRLARTPERANESADHSMHQNLHHQAASQIASDAPYASTMYAEHAAYSMPSPEVPPPALNVPDIMVDSIGLDVPMFSGDPPNPYIYSPLPSNFIRLLKLDPGQPNDLISCQLLPMPLTHETPSYAALSYVWGDTTQRTRVMCHGSPLSITRNLYLALQRLRRQDTPQLIWVDGICINQTDMNERAQQVRLMRAIFKSASKVIVWLGNEHSGHARQAFTVACQMMNKNRSYLDPANPQPATFNLSDDQVVSPGIGDMPPLDSPAWLSVQTLFQLPWFWRIWVLQEIALASSAVVVWGESSIPWRWIGFAAAHIRYNYPNVLRQYHMSGIFNAYFMFRIGIREPSIDPIQVPFSRLLSLTRQFESTDPRDRIFGLLGIPTTDTDPDAGDIFIEPNYNISAEELFLRVAQKIIQSENSLDLMSSVQHGTVINTALPSWVPQWSYGFTQRLLPSGSATIPSASAGLPVTIAIDTSNNQHLLHVKGAKVTGVRWILPQMYEEQFSSSGVMRSPLMQYADDLLPIFETVAEAVLEGVEVTMMAGKDWSGNAAGSENNEVDGADFEAYLRWCGEELGTTSQVLSAQQLATRRKLLELLFQARNSSQNTVASSQKQKGAGDAIRFTQASSNACKGRRLFVTTSNRLGLGPAAMKQGDTVVVLAGASMPYVVRRIPPNPFANDEPPRYRLVGECYLSDLMGGEAVERWKEGRLGLEDFVLV